MDKKQQIEYLKGALEQTITQYLENEVIISGLNTMSLIGKDQGKMAQMRDGARANKENLKTKIAAYRTIIIGVENGTIQV